MPLGLPLSKKPVYSVKSAYLGDVPGNTRSAGIKGYVSDVLLVLDVPLTSHWMILQVVGSELGALRLIDDCCISFMDLPPQTAQ